MFVQLSKHTQTHVALSTNAHTHTYRPFTPLSSECTHNFFCDNTSQYPQNPHNNTVLIKMINFQMFILPFTMPHCSPEWAIFTYFKMAPNNFVALFLSCSKISPQLTINWQAKFCEKTQTIHLQCFSKHCIVKQIMFLQDIFSANIYLNIEDLFLDNSVCPYKVEEPYVMIYGHQTNWSKCNSTIIHYHT